MNGQPQAAIQAEVREAEARAIVIADAMYPVGHNGLRAAHDVAPWNIARTAARRALQLTFECSECPLAEPFDCLKAGHCEHRDGPAPASAARTGDAETERRIWVRWSGDGQFIRKWSHEASDDGEPIDALAAPAGDADTRALVERLREISEWDCRDEAVLLLVDYSDGEHPIDDADFALTIGHNNDHNVGEGEGQGWQFAGWCWSHDHYTEGKGKPIGWLPLPHHLAAALSPQPVRQEVGR